MLDRRDLSLFRLLTIGQSILIVATWRVWFPQLDFPQVPLISIAGRVPRSVELGVVLLQAAGLLLLLASRSLRVQRSGVVFVAICSFVLILIDQHRLQPWAYQFLLVALVLGLSDDSTARRNWRWIVVGIYAWSAWSKIDYGFCLSHGPFLLDGLLSSIGVSSGTRFWSASSRYLASAAIPAFELLVALGLCFRRTRIAALWGAIVMHAGLLMALGPLGHRHQPGVLVWNMFFIVQDWILFRARASDRPESIENTATNQALTSTRFKQGLATLVVVLAMVWPVLETFGRCDHWTSWAVYAANPEVVSVYIHQDEQVNLPSEMARYLVMPSVVDEWRQVRIDRWSLDAVMVPLYPQDRFQVGVALGMADRFRLSQLKVVIESPANRWTGQRTTESYEGLPAIEKLASTYRLNAKPRPRLD